MTVLPWVGVGGAAVFVLTFLVDGWTRTGYSPVRHPVSALALGPRGWLQTTNFLLCGAMIVVGAVGMALAGTNVLLTAAVGVFGLALVASGVFPMDAMRGYPPGTADGTPSETTLRHRLHDVAGMIVFTSLPAAAAIAALTLDDLAWQLWSGITAATLTAGFIMFGQAWEADSPRAGLIQRGIIIIGWIWLAAVFAHAGMR